MENILFYNPDIRQLVENVSIGPQAEVKELIDAFNDKYIIYPTSSHRYWYLQTDGKTLGITKKFYWKPGCYDIIKQVIWHQIEMHKKAASLWKVVNRAKESSNWRLREVANKVANIERMLRDFRDRGIIQQDNTEDAVKAWEIVKNHLIEQFQASNGGFTVYMEENMYQSDGADPILKDYFINIVYEYDDVKIHYRHYENPDTIAEILLPGQGHLTVKMSLTKLINEVILAKMDLTKIPFNKILNRRNNSRNWFYDIGGYYCTYEGLQHPYISRSSTHWNREHNYDEYRYVCVGNLEEEIRGCIQSFDLISLKVFLDRVMTHYDTNTGPLNRIDETYHGQPKFLDGNKEYHNINPPKESRNCRYWEYIEQDDISYIKEESYCALYCSLKDTCNSYKAISKELTKEDLERKALEQATINAANRRV